ncbi:MULTISPECIES: homoserine dehydrogenase [Clostridium]|uniref:homoserine dehydrogenase n=1 Tax=Clostridium TaxID=1485 RepID=UPI00082222CD|nr:homoserine dehydrogenase [Clostridium saudiense]MDU7453213.1 homoserine dehydrogenase [Clostridium saudiense]SCJ61002.1 Homoserine dehydrogenase [uncultured Clostridium sp.]
MDIGLIGFGGVGQALIKLLIDKESYLLQQYNLKINVKYIIKSNGGIYNASGINLSEILKVIDENINITCHNEWKDNLNINDIIGNNDIDTLVELTSTNIETGEPGLTHIRKSLENNINVVTGNKGPILLDYKKLKVLADNNNVELKVGCTTGGALPSINGGIYDIAGSKIQSIEGVLNGTTNYILSKMANDNVDYKEALLEAQKVGIAESDPSLDVLGYDTASKIIILSNVLMNSDLKLEDLKINGIEEVRLDNIEKAKVRGNKIKLIGKVYKKDNLVKGYVTPIEIDENHPLYCVDYKNKGIYYKTDTLGDISIIGGASGTMNAAASILRDIILLRGV